MNGRRNKTEKRGEKKNRKKNRNKRHYITKDEDIKLITRKMKGRRNKRDKEVRKNG